MLFEDAGMSDRARLTARPESLPESAAERPQAIADEHPAEPAEYWWASVDGGAAEPVAIWREAGLCEQPPQPWGAERLGHEGLLWRERVRLIAPAVPPDGGPRDGG